MTLEKWYPEMPCDDCKQEADPVLTDKKQTGKIGVYR